MKEAIATTVRVDRNQWPFLVQLGLLGLPTRTSAWVFIWLSIAIAAGCLIYGFFNPIWFLGVGMVFAALWYYLAIRWVDQNSRWS